MHWLPTLIVAGTLVRTMVEPVRRTSRYQSLRQSREALRRTAPWLRMGIWSLGLTLFLNQARPLLSNAEFTRGERQVLGLVAFVTLGGFAVAGWIMGRLFKVGSELVDLMIDGAEASSRTADLIEQRLVPTFERIARTLENPVNTGRSSSAVGEAQLKKVRDAISLCDWDEAERLIKSLASGRMDPGETDSLERELTKARERTIEVHRRQLESARLAEDLDRVLDARDALTLHLVGRRLVDLDRQLAQWLTQVLVSRASSSQRPVEDALLARRVVETFGRSVETAPLQTALPSLFQRAQLCLGCSQIHRGGGTYCPRCRAERRSGSGEASFAATPNVPKDQI